MAILTKKPTLGVGFFNFGGPLELNPAPAVYESAALTKHELEAVSAFKPYHDGLPPPMHDCPDTTCQPALSGRRRLAAVRQ